MAVNHETICHQHEISKELQKNGSSFHFMHSFMFKTKKRIHKNKIDSLSANRNVENHFWSHLESSGKLPVAPDPPVGDHCSETSPDPVLLGSARSENMKKPILVLKQLQMKKFKRFLRCENSCRDHLQILLSKSSEHLV